MDKSYFRCIVCNQPLRPCFDSDDDRNTPVSGGLHFQAHGNYGSTIFDPAPHEPESHIEVVICDWCLTEKSNQVRLYMKNQEPQHMEVGDFEDQLEGCRGPGLRPEPRDELTPEEPESEPCE